MRALVLMLSSTLATACNDQCFVDGLNCEDTPPPAIQIAAGRAHSCATTTLGVLCWGDGDPPPGMPSYIRAAGDVTCGFHAGAEAIRCSGPEPIGALFGPGGGRYLAMAISATHGCAITHAFDGNGPLECWGDAPPPPQLVFDSIAAGAGHTCGLRGGMPMCWGRNDVGQSSPPAVTLASLVAADGYTCGLDPLGTISCWGLAPSPIPTGTFIELASADAFMCARRDDGTIACWGDPMDGRTVPPPGSYATVAVGERHGCAIDALGEITCWGANDRGQAAPP